MKDLINRYFDGELTEEEANTLRDAVARDPQIDEELRVWEHMLLAAEDSRAGEPSSVFTDRVMGSVATESGLITPRNKVLLGLGWGQSFAWAAALIVTFGLGALTAHFGARVLNGNSTGPMARPQSGSEQLSPASAAPTQEDLRIVRLVYAPSDPSVETVYVAGTFNNWNVQDIAMERKGDLWTAVLILPRGTYEYMFVEDQTNWVTDPLALKTRDDGFGRKNAVLDLAL